MTARRQKSAKAECIPQDVEQLAGRAFVELQALRDLLGILAFCPTAGVNLDECSPVALKNRIRRVNRVMY
jgi:hypothetical protein